MGINIPIAADSRQFIGATKDMEKGLDGVADALDDLVRDSQKGTDKLESGFKDAQRGADKLEEGFDDARQSAEKVERSYRDLADTAKRETKTAGDATKRNINEGSDAAKASMQEVKSEAIANASETFSSFDGSASGLVDGIQGTFGGLVSSLGPVGMAAGAAGAIGIGLISSALVESEEEAQALKEKVSELAQELIETGDDGSVSLGYIADQLKEMATTTDDGALSLAKMRKEAKDLGVPFSDLAQFYASGEGDIDSYISKVEDLIDIEQQRLTDLELSTGTGTSYSKELKELEATRAALKRVSDATADARQQEADYIAAGGPELEAKADSIENYRDSVTSSLDEAAGSWEDFYNAQTGALDIDKYIENYAKSVEAVEKYNTNLVSASETLSDEAVNYIRSMGVEAAPLLDAYVKAPASKKKEIERIWAANGKAAADGYAKDLEANIPDEVDGPTVKLKTEDWTETVRKAMEAAKRAVTGQSVTLDINARVPRNGNKVV